MKIDWCNVFGVNPDQVFKLKSGCVVLAGEFKVSENVLRHTSNPNNYWEICSLSLTAFSEIEVLLYPATKDEKTILRNLDEKYRNWYVARDLCKELYIYEKLPKKRDEYYALNAGLATRLPYSDLFQFIQFETGAVPIKDIIG